MAVETKASGTAVVRSAKEIKTFGDLVKWAAPQMAAILPKHLTPERMVALVNLAASKTPKLKECTPLSLFNAIMHASRLGLEIGSKAHLVPFNNSKLGAVECVMIPDYRGLADLARRDGQVRHIDARVVHLGDIFDYGLGDKPFISHKPTLRESVPPDSEILAFYAVAHLRDEGTVFEIMSKAEVDAIRGRSRAGKDGPWVTDYPMMGRKTVVKRLCKWLPQTAELQAAIELDNRAESGEIGAVSDIIDSPESLNAHVAERTADKVEELKAKMAEPEPTREQEAASPGASGEQADAVEPSPAPAGAKKGSKAQPF